MISNAIDLLGKYSVFSYDHLLKIYMNLKAIILQFIFHNACLATSSFRSVRQFAFFEEKQFKDYFYGNIHFISKTFNEISYRTIYMTYANVH